MNIFNLFNQVSKNTRKNLITSIKDPQKWPEEWKTVKIKKYKRFPKFFLPKPIKLVMPLSVSLGSRKSCRDFVKKIDTEIISTILFNSLGPREETIFGIEKRRYPSGGPLYPVEFYVFVFVQIDDIVPGIYHYGIEDNSLIQIKKDIFSQEIMDSLLIVDYAKKASFAVVMTAVFERNLIKYGERAYRFILLEAGGAAQNLALCATALDVGSIQMGGLVDEVAEELLEIDGSGEATIGSVFFG
ncbi:MAG: SagB/ThcOx family dehydrogenase [Candidatus Nomurabacteria bacterium]|nr:SagB/ThcOx family dehydrogenase [Candidatus Nomurabacteria bacterium]